jgi:hypothetical protein
VFWFVEIDFPDDDGGDRHRNMLQCNLILQEFYVHVIGTGFR